MPMPNRISSPHIYTNHYTTPTISSMPPVDIIRPLTRPAYTCKVIQSHSHYGRGNIYQTRGYTVHTYTQRKGPGSLVPRQLERDHHKPFGGLVGGPEAWMGRFKRTHGSTVTLNKANHWHRSAGDRAMATIRPIVLQLIDTVTTYGPPAWTGWYLWGGVVG